MKKLLILLTLSLANCGPRYTVIDTPYQHVCPAALELTTNTIANPFYAVTCEVTIQIPGTVSGVNVPNNSSVYLILGGLRCEYVESTNSIYSLGSCSNSDLTAGSSVTLPASTYLYLEAVDATQSSVLLQLTQVE